MNATKKIISILLVIATMMCLTVPAIAAEGEKTEELLPNGSAYVLEQHAIDTATEEKKWSGEENTYTDDDGNTWKYVNGRNYVVSKSDSQYLYREIADGEIAIIYDYTAESFDGEAIIPSELDGKTVTKIDAYAFYSCTNVTGIRVPDTVKEIGYYAFAYCSNIERVVIGSSVEKFNLQALYGISRSIQIFFTGSEEDADKIVVWDKVKLNAKIKFNWHSLTNNNKEEEMENFVKYNVNANKLDDTTTEYNLFVWFFKVYLKSFWDNFVALTKANIEGIKILFKGSSK